MDSVHVAIRVRPLIQRERNAEAETHWRADTHTITQLDHRGKACKKEYLFDRVFDSDETTSDVYEEIAQPIVLGSMDGINGTIFAYGQTSSGKTYTMMGTNDCPGVIPCAIQEIFDNIGNTRNREFLLRVSYMELYNEGLCDLLSSEKKALQIREVDRKVFVHELTEEVVTEPEEVLRLLKKGEARRHFGQTDMNERSSRSHTIFRMIIESREMENKKSQELAVRVSHLNLVDLAGSERANETKAEGARLKEACRINQSLHQLAMVINKLSQGADFIPFRDSKLTRILQMSLGGNAKTAIICTITPASVDQSHSTLQFASRAKTIKNKPQVNEILSDEAMMQRQKKEIQELKRKISELEQHGELLEEKASLHVQQEQKIKMLEKMILVSGGAAAIPSIMQGIDTKAKYKRRQTWCPGTGNPLSLFPLPKPAAVPGPTIEEMSFVSGTLSPPSTAKRSHSSSDGSDSSRSLSPPVSICSNDFSASKRMDFIERMEQAELEDSFQVPLPPSPGRQKRKRRRAHVHFSLGPESDSVDAECQTEPLNSLTSVLPKNAAESIASSPQEEQSSIVELKDKIRILESTITSMEAGVGDQETLSQALSQSRTHSENLQAEILRLEGIISSTQDKPEAMEESSSANMRCSELKQQVLLLEGKVASLEEEIAVASQSTDNQELRLTCKELRERNEELEGRIKDLEMENAMASELSDALCLSEEKVSLLEGQAQTAGIKLAALNEEIATLKAQLEQQDDTSKSEPEILALKAQLEERDAALAAAAEHSELEMGLLQGTIRELEDAVAALKVEKEGLSSLPKSLEEKEKQLEELCQMLQEAEDTIATLRLEKENSSNVENEKTAAKIQELQKTVELRDEEIEVLNQLLEEQGLEVGKITQASDKQHADAEMRDQESASTIANLSKEVKDLKALLEDRITEVETLQNRLQEHYIEAESQKQESTTTPGSLSQEVEDLKQLLEERCKEVEMLQSKLEEQSIEAEGQKRESSSTTGSLSQEVEDLKQLLEEQCKEVEMLQNNLKEQSTEAEGQKRESSATIVSLSQEVEDLKELLEEQCKEVDTLSCNLADQNKEAESQQQESALKMSTLSQQIADLERESASLAIDGLPASSDQGRTDSTGNSVQEVREAEGKLTELKKVLSSREEEIGSLRAILEEQTKETEEARSHHVARISELTALVEEQQGQIALSGAPSLGCADGSILTGMSLADELEAQDWKSKARVTESELLGSVQLCEDIMEEKTKLADQMTKLQAECKRLQEALRNKAEELERLQELHEFTQLEVTMTKEQENQYQNDIRKLEQQVQAQESARKEEHLEKIEELQKKLSVKDKVLEAQYQQDIDELLHKLREKNQQLDALQEQHSCLAHTLTLKEQLVEKLQEQMTLLGGSAESEEQCAGKQNIIAFQSAAETVDEGTQTELRECEAPSRKDLHHLEESSRAETLDEGTQTELRECEAPSRKDLHHLEASSPAETLDEGTQTELRECKAPSRKDLHHSEESSQVSPENLGLVGDGLSSLPGTHREERLSGVVPEDVSQDEALQCRISELESREATLKQRCDSMSTTITSQDQEIEVLNEILQEYGEDSKVDSAAQITAFVQRIEHLEEKLKNSNTHTRVIPSQESSDEPALSQELQALTEENENLCNALTQAENLCDELQGKLQHLEESSKLVDDANIQLQEELRVLTENSSSLSEKLNTFHVYCKELETKIVLLENEKQNASNVEICQSTEELEQQINDMIRQKAVMEQMVDMLRSKVTELEDHADKLSKENQDLLEKCRDAALVFNSSASEKESLMREQDSLTQLLHDSSSKVQELEGQLALLNSRFCEAAETIKNRDSEIEMMRQVLEEFEEQLKTTRHDYNRSVSRTQELELKVEAINQQKVNHNVRGEDEGKEVSRLQGILEGMEEQIQTKDGQHREMMSKIQHLESALDASTRKNLEKSQEGAEQQDKIQSMQNFLEEQADHLRTKEGMCKELGAKLQDLENLLTARNSKAAEREAVKLKLEEEVQSLERELDDMGDEFSQHKNSFADLQSISREQQVRIKELEHRLASQGENSKDLEAISSKQDEEIKVFRSLLDERNQRVLNYEDKHYEMQAKIQDLESANSSMKQALEELQQTIRRRDEELEQYNAALADQEREFQAHISELKLQMQSDRNTLGCQEEQKSQLQQAAEQGGKEIVALQQQLEEHNHEKSCILSRISQKDANIQSMQKSLEEYESENKILASKIMSLENEMRDLQTELRKKQDSPDSSEEVERLQQEKTEIQAKLDRVNRKLQRKTTDLDKQSKLLDTLQQTCSDLEDEFEAEKAQHLETKKRMEQAEADKARLEELDSKQASIEELMKTHQDKLAEKNLRINQLETDLLRGTDPLEDKIRSLRSEVRYQETKVQQHKKEIEKLRGQLAQNGHPPSDNTSALSAPRAPEATGGSGIIESCAIFAIKAENHKLTKALDKTKRELEHKDLKYHDEVSKKTQAERDMHYWKEKARSLANLLKRAPSSQTTNAVVASPLKERDANDPSSHQPVQKKRKHIERIPDLHRPAAVAATGSSKSDDQDWLSKVVAERDAAEAGKEKDDPQQCATQ